MPNIKSAIKRVKIEEKKTLNNNAKKSEYKTAIRKFEKAVADNSKDASDLLKKAQKAIDHASSNGVISKNAASRKVSRLGKKLAANAEAKEAKKEEKKVEKKAESKEKPAEVSTKKSSKKETASKKAE